LREDVEDYRALRVFQELEGFNELREIVAVDGAVVVEADMAARSFY